MRLQSIETSYYVAGCYMYDMSNDQVLNYDPKASLQVKCRYELLMYRIRFANRLSFRIIVGSVAG